MLPKQTEYKVGMYLRLSKDDERVGESLSIENQRRVLINHIKEQGWKLYDEYVDDGISETSFDRPSVQRMLDDAKSGKINLIICKDLSRFGRNYIQVGQYTDYIFPMYNIRFIALTDNVDTLNSDSAGMDMMPIMNVFNEWHAASTSKKIRAVMQSKAKQGKYTASIAAYGYLVGDDELRRPVIDENTAPNVRRMFEMRAKGASSPQIAKALNADHVITPSNYTYKRLGKANPYVTTHLWSAGMVRDILKNPVYVGSVVGQKYTTVSYKNHKKYIRDKDEWIVSENAFEGIVSKELWDKVQEVNKSVSRGTTTRNGEILQLCGLMYCADCGSKMKKCTTTHTSKTKGKYQLVAYSCNNYANHGRTACSSHHIVQSLIEEIILTDIRAKAKLIVEDESMAREMYLAEKNTLHEKQSADAEKQLKQAEKRLAELDTIITKTYEDRMLGRMPEELSIKMLDKYLAEQSALNEKVKELKLAESMYNKDRQDVEEFMKRIRKYIDVQELTREMCLELIEYVVVHERPEQYGAPRKIHIYYKLLSKRLEDSRNLFLPQNNVEIFI